LAAPIPPRPTLTLRKEIEDTFAGIKLSPRSPQRAIQGADDHSKLLVIGIGGSALGPQFVPTHWTSHDDKLSVYFFDNSDPDGMDEFCRKSARNSARPCAWSFLNPAAPRKPAMHVGSPMAYERNGLKFVLTLSPLPAV